MNSATRSWSYFMCVFVPFFSRNTHKSSANIMTTECWKIAWFTASVRLWVFISIQKPIAFAITLQELYNIGWPWGGYKNILPEMLTILPESKTRVILLASRAIYSCIPRKRAIQYYYYSYRALCVILLSSDRGWLPAAILSSHESESLWDVATVTKVGGA